MKNILLIISLLVIYSCSSVGERKDKKAAKSSSDQSTVKMDKPMEITRKLDTLSFEYFLELSDNIIEEIPRYHINKFIGNKWDDENDPYRKIYSEDTDHYKLYENYLLTFSVSMYGVAGETILASYSSEGEMIDYLSVEQSSDMDLSSTSYSSRHFQIFADSLVQILGQTTRAKNYNYHMPDTIDLFDLDSTEITETLDYTFYVIKRSGEFQKVYPLQKILDKQKLEHLSKLNLRLKRNEFFAKLGYRFKSPDLLEHFGKLSWYSPKYNDVTDKLSPFDIYNINMIKQIENK